MFPSVLAVYGKMVPIGMQAIFKPPKAMRGGIQICFPQVLSFLGMFTLIRFNYFIQLICYKHLKFGNFGSLEQHGFARNRMWSIDNDPPPLHQYDSNAKVFVDLLLKPSEDDMKCWPH